MQRRLGIIPDRCARPLFERFREPEFGIVSGSPGELAVKLRGRKLDGAFLSPVDAAKHPGTVRPAGPAALVSHAAAGTARLLFREGIREIGSVAVDPGRTSEIVLAHLVLVEKYGSAPKIIPRTVAIAELPSSVDAILLAGDEAGGVDPSEPWIDLVEDWHDITGLPFVHGLWYTAGEAFDDGDAGLFAPPGAAEIAVADEDPAAGGAGAAAGSQPPGGEDGGEDEEGGNDASDAVWTGRPWAVTYALGEEERSGLIEFIRMAYYHGILKEIPETNSFLPG